MCWIKYKIEVDQTWWFSVSKPKKMSDVCPIFAACHVEFETENDQTWLFSLCKPKNVRKSHFCCVPNSVRVKEWSKLTIFTLKTWNWIYEVCHIFVGCRIECEVENQTKAAFFYSVKPKKCTIYVTFLLRAERECEIKNDQS